MSSEIAEMEYVDFQPGPGQYSISKGLTQIRKNPEGHVFPKAELHRIKDPVSVIPGPGQYDRDSKKQKIYERVLCYFGDKNQIDKFYYPDLLMKNSPTPLVNDANDAMKKKPKKKHKQMDVSFEREFNYIDKEKLKYPGPGYYQCLPPQKPIGTSGIKFPRSKEFHSSYLRKDKGPGPGDYVTEPIKPQKGLKFKTEGLNISNSAKEILVVPGPGFYSTKPDIMLNRFLNKPPAFSFRKARSQTPKNNNPGPLDYTPTKPIKHSPQAFFGSGVKRIKVEKIQRNESPGVVGTLHESKGHRSLKKIKGLPFGNEIREFEFGEIKKLKCSIGPGEYHPQIENIRGKSPGGGFAKSERCTKIKQSPGPGDYKF